MTHLKTKNKEKVFIFWVISFCATGLPLACQNSVQNMPDVNAEEKLISGIAKLSKERSEAEAAFYELDKKFFEKKDSYIQGRNYYAKAKGEFDGWIDAFKTVLPLKVSPDKSEIFNKQMKKAVIASEKFKKYVSDLEIASLNSKDRQKLSNSIEQEGVFPIADLIVGLTKGGILIWEANREAERKNNEALQKKIKQNLEEQRWKPYRELQKKR